MITEEERKYLSIIIKTNWTNSNEIKGFIVPWIYNNTEVKIYKTGNICEAKANRLRLNVINYYSKKLNISKLDIIKGKF